MTTYQGEERRDNHWHLDKRLNVGHLLTTLSLAGAMIMWAMTIETRLVEQATIQRALALQVDKTEARSIRSTDRILVLVDKMNDKLDRLIEHK